MGALAFVYSSFGLTHILDTGCRNAILIQIKLDLRETLSAGCREAECMMPQRSFDSHQV